MGNFFSSRAQFYFCRILYDGVVRNMEKAVEMTALVRLEHPEGGQLVLIGNFEDLSPSDKSLWQGELRRRRREECFPVINRGAPWYDTLTQEQRLTLNQWYEEWLNAPQTGVAPVMPENLRENIER